MIDSKPPGNSDLYLDFSQFNKLRKLNADNQDEGLRAAAKQMESIFLNMMLQSMREANSAFSEGNMLESRESDFFRGMYDKQLASDISNGQGIGLADVIVRQLSKQNTTPASASQDSYGVSQYMDSKVPAVFVRSKREDSTPVVGNKSEAVSDPKALEAVTWNSPEQFVEAIYPFAEQAAKRLGVGVDAILAQAALETGWGKHVMPNTKGVSSHNFFGIKADMRWDGDATRKNTLEYRNGIAAKEVASFRSYPSLDEAFQDYVSFLKNNARYTQVFEKNIDAKQWGYELQSAGYATDPNYGNKIANIIDSDVLQSVVQQRSKKI